ncbi:MAG TPA: hypothetical protein VGC77_22115, partial [Rhodopseudomonas sp.]|uniref:hypothetical protein n=1 Tax=Rhodopseudomonas sp. TaxID=1078 RepID=UPI002ED87506
AMHQARMGQPERISDLNFAVWRSGHGAPVGGARTGSQQAGCRPPAEKTMDNKKAGASAGLSEIRRKLREKLRSDQYFARSGAPPRLKR